LDDIGNLFRGIGSWIRADIDPIFAGKNATISLFRGIHSLDDSGFLALCQF